MSIWSESAPTRCARSWAATPSSRHSKSTWSQAPEHEGGHSISTSDGKITLEHIECNAACDYAPVMMVNWEFFDNQTPESARSLVDALRAGERVTPDRGAHAVLVPARPRAFWLVFRIANRGSRSDRPSAMPLLPDYVCAEPISAPEAGARPNDDHPDSEPRPPERCDKPARRPRDSATSDTRTDPDEGSVTCPDPVLSRFWDNEFMDPRQLPSPRRLPGAAQSAGHGPRRRDRIRQGRGPARTRRRRLPDRN